MNIPKPSFQGGTTEKSWLGGCFLSKIGKTDLLSLICQWIKNQDKCQNITAINVSKLVAMQSDEKLAEFVSGSTINIADGMPVYLACRLTGDPIPERITGVGLMEDLLELANQNAFRVFFLGSKPDVLTKVLERCSQKFPSLVIAGVQDGYFERGTEAVIATNIGTTNPDIVLVALGVPQKEYFVDDHIEKLNTSLALPVGGAFDVFAGSKVRAPDWVQKVGVEWLWRSVYDRSRAGLIRKSFLPFLGIVLKEIYQQRILGNRK